MHLRRRQSVGQSACVAGPKGLWVGSTNNDSAPQLALDHVRSEPLLIQQRARRATEPHRQSSARPSRLIGDASHQLRQLFRARCREFAALYGRQRACIAWSFRGQGNSGIGEQRHGRGEMVRLGRVRRTERLATPRVRKTRHDCRTFERSCGEGRHGDDGDATLRLTVGPDHAQRTSTL
jgi:hypothetical protein